MPAAVLLLTLVAALGCDGDRPIEDIAMLEDARSLGEGRLLRYFENPSAGVRARAVRAAGRIEDPATVDALSDRLEDGDPVVVREAAFALGQIARMNPEHRDGITEALVRRPLTMGHRRDAVALEVVAALSKAGGPLAERAVLRFLTSPFPAVRGEAALAYQRMGLHARTDLVLPLLEDPDEGVRWRGLFALFGDDSEEAFRAMVRALQDSSAVVRQTACRALAASGHPSAGRAVADRLEQAEWEPSVQSAAVMALGRIGDPGTRPTLVKYIHSVWPQARMAAVRALDRLSAELNAGDVFALADGASVQARALAAEALGRLSVPEARPRLAALSRDSSRTVRRAATRALARAERDIRAEFLRSSDAWIRAAALEGEVAAEGLGAGGDLHRALQDPDPLVVVTALTLTETLLRRDPALASDASWFGGGAVGPALAACVDGAARAPVKRALLAALLPLSPSCRTLLPFVRDADFGVRTAAFDAASRAVDAADCPLPPERLVESLGWPSPAPTDYPDLDRLPRRAEVVTNHGSFVVRLHGRAAPRTVANFIRLARAHAYDGTGFIGITPDSVLIAGCPRGDGFSDPGYTIRCEINPHRFERGTLGMRAPSRDGGNTQFIITLAPQPDLDGHLTVFGTVIHGMRMLDTLTLDTRIERIIIG